MSFLTHGFPMIESELTHIRLLPTEFLPSYDGSRYQSSL